MIYSGCGREAGTAMFSYFWKGYIGLMRGWQLEIDTRQLWR
jgi:hypothetical protein